MNTLCRFLLIVALGVVGQPVALAQLQPIERCPGNFDHVDDVELERLETKFIAQLQQHATQTGVAAFAGYNKWASLRPAGRIRSPLSDRVCSEMPHLCKADTRDICAAAPGACPQVGFWATPASLEETLEAAQAAARAAISGSTPLGTRASLLARVSASGALSGFPNAVRQQVGDHALALELLTEGRKQTAEFHASLIHESCAASFILDYPTMVGNPPTASTMADQLQGADAGLSGFGLPGEVVQFTLTGDMNENADFFEGFIPHVNTALAVANQMLSITGTVRTELFYLDGQIGIVGAGLEPFSGHHFRMEWWIAPMFMHEWNATAARRELDFDRNSISDGIALLRGSLPQFPPGGGDGPGFPGTLAGPIHDYCGTSGSLATDFPAVLDDQGRIGPFLQTQVAADMRRGDAQLIVQAMLGCAMQMARQAAVTLRLENFVLDTSFATERTITSSVLQQRMEDKRDNYDARAKAASARAAEIDQIVP